MSCISSKIHSHRCVMALLQWHQWSVVKMSFQTSVMALNSLNNTVYCNLRAGRKIYCAMWKILDQPLGILVFLFDWEAYPNKAQALLELFYWDLGLYLLSAFVVVLLHIHWISFCDGPITKQCPLWCDLHITMFCIIASVSTIFTLTDCSKRGLFFDLLSHSNLRHQENFFFVLHWFPTQNKPKWAMIVPYNGVAGWTWTCCYQFLFASPLLLTISHLVTL